MASLQRQKADHSSPGTRGAANGELSFKVYSISAKDDEEIVETESGNSFTIL